MGVELERKQLRKKMHVVYTDNLMNHIIGTITDLKKDYATIRNAKGYLKAPYGRLGILDIEATLNGMKNN